MYLAPTAVEAFVTVASNDSSPEESEMRFGWNQCKKFPLLVVGSIMNATKVELASP